MKKYHPLAVLSAYTGILLCKFSDMHEYIEEVLERPVFTHELASDSLSNQIRDKIMENGDFQRALNEINEALYERIING